MKATYLYQVCVVQEKMQTKAYMKKIHQLLRENCVSAKKYKIFNKNKQLTFSGIHLLNACAILVPIYLYSIGHVNFSLSL